MGWGAVLNVYTSDAPSVVCAAEVNSPPVLERLNPRPEPDVAPEGDIVEGWVRNANASFSDLKGTVISAPDSSPSVTTVTLPPGYFFCSCAFALAISAGVNPLTEAPLVPCMRDFGKRSFRPTVTEPSELKVALVS